MKVHFLVERGGRLASVCGNMNGNPHIQEEGWEEAEGERCKRCMKIVERDRP